MNNHPALCLVLLRMGFKRSQLSPLLKSVPTENQRSYFRDQHDQIQYKDMAVIHYLTSVLRWLIVTYLLCDLTEVLA